MSIDNYVNNPNLLVPIYYNCIRINHQRKSFSSNTDQLLEKNQENSFLNKFSSNHIIKDGNKSFEKAVIRISQIEQRSLFGNKKPNSFHALEKHDNYIEKLYSNKKEQDIINNNKEFSNQPLGIYSKY